MIETVSGYLKNIAVFVIFITFVDLLLPDNRYRGYINLMGGFILIFIMLAPASGMLRLMEGGVWKPLDFSTSLNKSIMQKEQAYYANEQKELILKTYGEEIKKQLKELIESNTEHFIYEDCALTVSDAEEDLGELHFISLILAETEAPKKLIRIERIKISGDETAETEENEEVNKLKKIILDFYNLSEANIHISVRKKEG